MTITSNLSGSAKRALRAAAHHLDPVVMIGDKGLTAAVLHEIDIALAAHALIKVRVASDDREQRVAFMNDICAKLACESVQHLGKLLVLWRNKEGDDGVLSDDEAAEVAAPASRARGPRKKLANDATAGFRRPDASDPRPREGRSYGGRGEGSRDNAAPRTGGYGRAREGDAPAPRGRGGYGANEGFAKPSGGFSKPAGDRYAAPRGA
ncbi:MAG: YhbY family RNA-binding protein, partial [Casimicrobium sp.]